MFSSKSRKRRRNYHTITAHSAKKELGENGVWVSKQNTSFEHVKYACTVAFLPREASRTSRMCGIICSLDLVPSAAAGWAK